jgi:hypothetical protein
MPLQKSSTNTMDMMVRSVSVLHVGSAKVGGTCWQWLVLVSVGISYPRVDGESKDASDEFSCGLRCYTKIGWAVFPPHL